MKAGHSALLVAATLALPVGSAVAQSRRAPAAPTIPAGFTYVKTSAGIQEYTMDANKMQVLVKEDHAAPVVAVMVTYHVGSRNETIGYTGSTHLLEHLMFKGTPTYNKDKGTAIFTMLERIGANMNATTWNDRTNYYEVVPSDQIELALAIESDRMRNSLIAEADREAEMTVVRNEFERGQNDPGSVLSENVWSIAYMAHPYHHSTIGWRSDIENVPIARLKAFYDTYYWPNNATLTVIGDVTPAVALAKAQAAFGKITVSPNPFPEPYTTEPEQQGVRTVTLRRAGETGVVDIAHKSPETLSADADALYVLGDILSTGKSSRFYKLLVDQTLATSVNAGPSQFKDAGLFETTVDLVPGVSHDRVRDSVMAEYGRIKTRGVTAEELNRAKAQIRARQAFGRDGAFSVASRINEAIAIGDWTYYTTFNDRMAKVTAADIQRVAQKYLVDDQSTIGYFIPITASGGGSTSSLVAPTDRSMGWTAAGRGPNFYREPTAGTMFDGNRALTPTPDGSAIAPQVKVDRMGDITLYTMPTQIEDVVSFTGSFNGAGKMAAPSNPELAALTVAMLDKGTVSQDKYAVAAKLEGVGAQLTFSSGVERVTFSGRALRADLPMVIGLLAEQLRQPRFDQAEFDKVKAQRIAALRRQVGETSARAYEAFARTVYPQGHPNYTLPTEDRIKQVEATTLADVKAFYNRTYGKQDLKFVAVGDVDAKALASAVKSSLGSWSAKPVQLDFVGTVQAPTAAVARQVVTMKDKANVDVYLGHALPFDYDDPQYLPAYLAGYVLGGNFSARLMSTVRDRQGLTYGIYSYLPGMGDRTQGAWLSGVTLAPNLTQKGLDATMEQINLFAEKGISDAELVEKKATITGEYKVGLSTTRGLAGAIHNAVTSTRGLAWVDDYPKRIDALTLDQVNGSIKQYFHPDRMAVILAGSVDDKLVPLAPAN